MMAAAAVCVHHSLAGVQIKQRPATAVASTDTVTLGADGELVIHTRVLTDAIGYAGPVPLDIHIRDGRVEHVEALDNAETPGFFKRASALLDAWQGKPVAEAASMKVDAVSGATYTSRAIEANVKAGLDYYMRTQSAPAAPDMPWRMWVALAVTLAACVLPLVVKSRIYHRVQLVANVVVLGFWCGAFLDYQLMLRYLAQGITLPAALVAMVMLVAAFIFPLFGRPQHYCLHICPFGSAQQLVAEVCRYKIKIGRRTLRVLNYLRRLLWCVLMLLLWADVATSWMDLELFRAFMIDTAPAGILIAAAGFLLLSAVVTRPYCRFVCPTGTLFKTAENR